MGDNDELLRAVGSRLKRIEDWQPTVDARLSDLLQMHSIAASERGEVKAITQQLAGKVENVVRQNYQFGNDLAAVKSSVNLMVSRGRSLRMFASRVVSSAGGVVLSALILLVLSRLFGWHF